MPYLHKYRQASRLFRRRLQNEDAGSAQPRLARRAFTLIELLTVIAIVAILAAILIPVVQDARQHANMAKALSSARQIGIAAMMYSVDNADDIPATGGTPASPNIADGNVECRLAAYLLGISPSAVMWRDVNKAMVGLKDPAIPDELCWYSHPGTWAWSINESFADWKNAGSFMKRSQVSNPAKIIYAATGTYVLTPAMLESEAYRKLPASKRNGLYVAYQDKFPVVYLDGHTEMLAFPADKKLVRPDEW